MDSAQTGLLRYKGREFSSRELSLIKEIAGDFPGIARTELANTVCELLDWKSPGNKLKTVECRTFLELLDARGVLKLPEKRNTSKKKSVTVTVAVAVPIPPIRKSEPLAEVAGSVEDFAPLDVELVETKEQRRLFRDLVRDYHYLGYATPYGTRLQYLAYVTGPVRRIAGCIQFTSPAWRMMARDQWIGWDDTIRGQHLQHIVNNSRFLVLARVRNLPSMLLSMVLKRLREDWHAH
ncbi:MAG: Druantia anti-phage system protein DruA [Pseudomonadota bacterium]